jgi:hypothetical protein
MPGIIYSSWRAQLVIASAAKQSPRHCERSEAIPPSLRAQLVIASAAKQSSLALASHGNSNAAHRSKAATFATHPSRHGWRDKGSLAMTGRKKPA